MRREIKEGYIKLVEFLGLVLGPNYEVTLHDLSLKDESIIAIANGHITGRNVGGSVPEFFKAERNINHQPTEEYRVNYKTVCNGNRRLRTSSLYIKDGGRNVGLLCITFDDTQFRDASKQIMELCNPTGPIDAGTFEKVETLRPEKNLELYGTEVGQILPAMLNSAVLKYGIPIEKMKKKDKLKIVKELDDKGIFLVKGAAEELAAMLAVSVPTIYRYLKEVKADAK